MKTNKTQHQQELLKKIKPGIKPSDLKKIKNNPIKSADIPTPPSPPVKPTKKNALPSKTTNKTQPIQTFSCPTCRSSHKNPIWIKVAQTDPEYNLIRGKKYPFCSQCSPKIKEFNEYDLITPELWEKYPYSSASEILEREFNLKKEERW